MKDKKFLPLYAVEGRYAILCDDLSDAKAFLDKAKILLDFVKKKIRCKAKE